ncbi:Ribosomal large subunit pseudouridine synthase B [hydrothermal vent metagenome]|uniref:Ribosomal large subunit pseudouridine synthase B n=1 Tax=hydrothermal vent metagenome TaxID=652676 RepID=A0A3B0Z2M2_9ZZZZ
MSKDKVSLKGERIQKVLSRLGHGSRREIEGWIKEQRLTVNGKVAELGDRIIEKDVVRLDKRHLRSASSSEEAHQTLIYNKPEGEICTRSDPENRKTVFQNLPKTEQGRWIAVGRLDITTMGLLIFTTDGELANKLMHPSNEVEREYAVRILGHVETEHLETLTSGVMLDDGKARFTSITFSGGEGANRWYSVTLKEGRNREVRRLWESQGLTVTRLIRTRFGPVTLPRKVRNGHTEFLEKKELKLLYEAVGMTLPEDMTDRFKSKERKTRPNPYRGKSEKKPVTKRTLKSRRR